MAPGDPTDPEPPPRSAGLWERWAGPWRSWRWRFLALFAPSGPGRCPACGLPRHRTEAPGLGPPYCRRCGAPYDR